MSVRFTAALVLSIPLCGAAQADHYLQTADPQVVQAINELIQVYGGACQQGHQQACNIAQLIQQQGGMMLNAGYDCQTQSNQQACVFYRQAYGQMEQTYYQTQQAINEGRFGAGSANNYSQYDHSQRMQEIHNWGQQRLEWGRQQSAI